MKLLITGMVLIFSLSGLATDSVQQTTIKGVVKSAVDSTTLRGVNVTVKEFVNGTTTDKDGRFTLQIDKKATSLHKVTVRFTLTGYKNKQIEVSLDQPRNLEVFLEHIPTAQQEITISMDASLQSKGYLSMPRTHQMGNYNTESYDHIEENTYQAVSDKPLSTFSIDVDAASYSNMRRMINEGRMPVKDAIRIEEMINYFDYDYPDPAGEHPFSITLESGEVPWNAKHQLVHIGLQGERMEEQELPPSNLVFLLDVSGSMQSPRKLPLLKSAFRMLVN